MTFLVLQFNILHNAFTQMVSFLVLVLAYIKYQEKTLALPTTELVSAIIMIFQLSSKIQEGQERVTQDVSVGMNAGANILGVNFSIGWHSGYTYTTPLTAVSDYGKYNHQTWEDRNYSGMLASTLFAGERSTGMQQLLPAWDSHKRSYNRMSKADNTPLNAVTGLENVNLRGISQQITGKIENSKSFAGRKQPPLGKRTEHKMADTTVEHKQRKGYFGKTKKWSSKVEEGVFAEHRVHPILMRATQNIMVFKKSR